MSHPVDVEAWHAMDRFDLAFAWDLRNYRLGLSTDGFQPYGSDSTPYSCWPIFVMPYNLPSNKCLNEEFIFLVLVILGPKEPKKQTNIFLHPLMEELKELWQWVDAYDSHLKCPFNLWVYLCLIHDYLAYGKFVGWCVHGRLNYPVYMDESDAFRLQHSRKVNFFIVIEDSFHCVMSSGVTKSQFRKIRALEKGHQSESSEQIS
jgi:hypothetical protein